jgi:hypothetical protein
MKQFGFPQIARGDGGGDGGGGDGSDGEAEDAYAEAYANDHTDFSSNAVGLGSLANSDFSSMEPDMGFDEVGFGNVDWDAYGPSQSFADRAGPAFSAFEPTDWGQGPNQGVAQDYDPFGFGPNGTFGQPGQSFADTWGQMGLGYNNPTASNPGVDVVGWDQYNSIDAQAPAMSYGPAYASRDTPGFRSAMDFPVSDWSNAPSLGWGWSPGQSIGQIEVSRGPDGQVGQVTPGTPQGSMPTSSYGLPAAMYPGARAGEIDFAAISNSGIDTLFSNTRGNVSPAALAAEQARHIPRPNGSGGWMTDTRGNISLDLYDPNETVPGDPYEWAPGQWISDTRGNLSPDDSAVQAVMARRRG